MYLPLLLDSNVLGSILRPDLDANKPVAAAIRRLQRDPRFRVYIPAITDYELRRKLLHLGLQRHQPRKWVRKALVDLDELVSAGYVPLTTKTLRLAASLWAQTRAAGQLRDSEDGLDVDVILAAQARQFGGHIVTTNEKHFRDIAEVFDWRPFQDA
ncbi:MAG TPA: PIN domain-containing protein [Thermoanaerobaculia bacterium]|jgi:predicted nucleic acid-binding protein|nr:PIN domain-containing protein [Thermoanaerobaculia bacterium]